MKSLTMVGMVVGSTIGGFVPALWGGDLLSLTSITCTVIGGLAGIWIGFRLES